MSELVAKMNVWDATGNWKLDAAAKAIKGGDRKKFYSTLVIKSANGTNTTLDLNTQLIPQGVALKLNVGTHNIKVVSKATGCSDEIAVKVTCTVQPANCKSFIADKDRYVYSTVKGVKGTTCLEIPYANLADYTITDNNATYTGKTEACTTGTSFEIECGIHEMIFKTKDGCRDTILIKVACVSAKQIVDTIYVAQVDTSCLDVTELLGKIKNISNVAPTKSGEHAIFSLVPNSRCVTYKGIEAGGTDEAVYVMADDKGISDTTFFKITVIAKVAQITPAVAVVDNLTTKVNESVVVNLLANDTLRSAITSIEIIDQPLHGTVELLQNGIATYTPNKGFCGGNGDQFSYRVCTAGGCSTARVTVKVTCKEVNVFTGFSPNGDNMNDFFVIEGAQEYADNTVKVYDRQGNAVFEQKGYRNDWNGTWKGGKNLPDGTYFYLFNNGKGETKTGYVHIQR
jgi:gliding motility-associated-like protein